MTKRAQIFGTYLATATSICLLLGAGACHGCGNKASDVPVRVDAGPRRDAGHDAGPDLGPPDSGAEDPQIVRGLRGGGSFFERPDGDVRERLASLDLAHVERGYGGRSVAFKIRLSDGTQGYYKPNQRFSAAHWWSEVASYHLDRELRLGRVPPVVSRRLRWDVLRRSAPSDERFSEVIVEEDGTMCGSFSYWIPDRLSPVHLPSGWERWLRVAGHYGTTTPFQRPREYVAALHGGHFPEDAGPLDPNAAAVAPSPPPSVPVAGQSPVANDEANQTDVSHAAAEPDRRDRDAELSDLVVFDFLTQNTDRWGGGNANVLTRGGGAIVFLDNAAGFPQRGPARIGLMDARLRVVQRFRGRTLAALRAFDIHALERRMRAEPCAPILDSAQLSALDERRRAVLQRAAEMQQQYGDAAIPW
ncbi:MAG: hypothetical protein IPK60_14140 [Sandaracinaceae bacterium]|nr:hypothetical protein [Sandaracinaceae bacterium]